MNDAHLVAAMALYLRLRESLCLVSDRMTCCLSLRSSLRCSLRWSDRWNTSSAASKVMSVEPKLPFSSEDRNSLGNASDVEKKTHW